MGRIEPFPSHFSNKWDWVCATGKLWWHPRIQKHTFSKLLLATRYGIHHTACMTEHRFNLAEHLLKMSATENFRNCCLLHGMHCMAEQWSNIAERLLERNATRIFDDTHWFNCTPSPNCNWLHGRALIPPPPPIPATNGMGVEEALISKEDAPACARWACVGHWTLCCTPDTCAAIYNITQTNAQQKFRH